MEALKILEHPKNLTWDYDEEADVLYLSVGEPKPALGVDIGDGVLIRYDEKKQELTGITLTGIRQKLLTSLK